MHYVTTSSIVRTVVMILYDSMILLLVFQLLADGVIPNEYGINPKQKLKIGSKVNIAQRLLKLIVLF